MEEKLRLVQEKLDALPREELGCWPTPLHRLTGMAAQLGYPELYIKRDDLNGVGPGGNKVRTLEYLLGKARAEGANALLASGPAQSNLCTLAACCASRLGMRCVLVHNAPAPDRFEGNALLNHLVGAESVYMGRGFDEAQRAARTGQMAQQLQEEGYHPYTVLLGGSTGLGAVGYIPVLLELLAQQPPQNPIRHLFVPGGNGGVAAGMVYGNQVLGRPFQVHVISVEYPHDVLKGHMQRIIAEMEEVTGLPFGADVDDACDLQDAYMGQGWGCNTPESEAMVTAFARSEGIFIEHVYTSKVVVAMADYIRRGALTGGVCFLHTGGLGSLFAQY